MLYSSINSKKAIKLAKNNYGLANIKLENSQYIFILEITGEAYLLDKTSILRQYFFFNSKKEFKDLINRFKIANKDISIKLELF